MKRSEQILNLETQGIFSSVILGQSVIHKNSGALAQATSGFNDIILYNPDAWDSWTRTAIREFVHVARA